MVYVPALRFLKLKLPSEPVTVELPPGVKITLTTDTGSPVVLSATIPVRVPVEFSSTLACVHEKNSPAQAIKAMTMFLMSCMV